MFINAVNKKLSNKPEGVNLRWFIRGDWHSTKTRLTALLSAHYRAARKAKNKDKMEYYFCSGNISIQLTTHRSPTPNKLTVLINNVTQDNTMCNNYAFHPNLPVSETINDIADDIIGYLQQCLLELGYELHSLTEEQMATLTKIYFA